VVFKVIKHGEIKNLKVFHLKDPTHKATKPVFSVPLSKCLQNPDFTIPLQWSPEISTILEELKACRLNLGHPTSGFRPMIALQAYLKGKGTPPQSQEDVKKHIYDRLFKEDQNTHPYLQGADIKRYHITWSGGYLKYGPWLADPQSLDRYSGGRILVREIINEKPYLLNACFTEDTYLYNKSVLHILPAPDLPKDHLLALLAILNSKLVSFVLQFRGRKTQRKLFRKIVNADLKDLPLPYEFESKAVSLAELAHKMMCLYDNTKGDLTAAATISEAKRLQSQIDQTVYVAYNLSPKAGQAIESIMAPA